MEGEMNLDDIASVPRGEIPKLIIALTARLLEPEPAEPASDEPDRMLTASEAAERLRRSPKWLSRHRKSLPFARRLASRSWVYSESGLKRWLSRQK
jgi:Helix-turn-helix domain